MVFTLESRVKVENVSIRGTQMDLLSTGLNSLLRFFHKCFTTLQFLTYSEAKQWGQKIKNRKNKLR